MTVQLNSFCPFFQKKKRMPYTTKYAKYDSAVNDISIDRRSHFGKPLGEEFLRYFQILDGKQNDIQT